MKKIVTFHICEKVEYCPVILNNNYLTSNGGGRVELSVEEDALLNLLGLFDEDVNYIVDFADYCEGTISTNNMILRNFAKKNIIIIAPEKLKEAFLTQNLGKYEMYEEEAKIFSIFFDKKGEAYTFIQTAKEQIKNVKQNYFLHKYVLTKFFLDDIKNNPQYSFERGNLKYLESSNVYVNKYINVKSLFLNCNYMMLVIKDLKKIIKREFKNNLDEIILLGVSNNGIILANLLSYELQRPAQSLNRLGPVYCLDKKIDRNNHFNNKKYVLVSDVVCMGGEYKMAQGIVDILGGALLGGVCVVKIRDVYRNKNEHHISALIEDINAITIDNKNINYQIFIDDMADNCEI